MLLGQKSFHQANHKARAVALKPFNDSTKKGITLGEVCEGLQSEMQLSTCTSTEKSGRHPFSSIL